VNDVEAQEMKHLIGWFASNADKPFINRMINAKKFDPKIHGLGMDYRDGKTVVFPQHSSERRNTKKKKLFKQTPERAYQKAMKEGDFLEFSSPEEASWFMDNYKRIWD
jgi:hypothetical protein